MNATRAATTPTRTTRVDHGPLSPTAGELWSSIRGPLTVVAILIGAALLMAIINNTDRRGFLDPEGVDRSGSRALSRLLAAQGVDVREVRTTDAAVTAARPGSTMLVTVPDLLLPSQVERVRDSGADLVLVAPQNPAVLGGDLAITGTAPAQSRDPHCNEPIPQRAGSARLGGVLYSSDASDAASCYPDDQGSAMVVARDGNRSVTVLGSADFLTNQYLDEDGNAALATGLLGQHERLIWYRPLPEPGQTGGTASIRELLPGWVGPAVGQLLIAAVIAALWRARRLGPVVTEPLPVIVRAAEVVEGRARLYRRASARDRAAAALREATVRRLAGRLGLPVGAPVLAVAIAVSARIGRPESDVTALLDGPVPADDVALVRLADSLNALDEEVRNS